MDILRVKAIAILLPIYYGIIMILFAIAVALYEAGKLAICATHTPAEVVSVILYQVFKRNIDCF